VSDIYYIKPKPLLNLFVDSGAEKSSGSFACGSQLN